MIDRRSEARTTEDVTAPVVAGRGAVRAVVSAVALVVVLVAFGPRTPTANVAAQPLPTPPPAGPPPNLAGEWSITRSWWRSCPRCSSVVVRTTPWLIEQSGAEVWVDRGPRGQVVADGSGGGLLNLDGLENEAGSVYRFWYGSLRVSPDLARFEGGFNGSERIMNPCGPNPPIVTCFASAGYVRAVRVSPAPASATSPPLPTFAPPSTATPTTSPTAVAPPTATDSPTSTSTPTPLPTPHPGPPGHFPWVRR